MSEYVVMKARQRTTSPSGFWRVWTLLNRRARRGRTSERRRTHTTVTVMDWAAFHGHRYARPVSVLRVSDQVISRCLCLSMTRDRLLTAASSEVIRTRRASHR